MNDVVVPEEIETSVQIFSRVLRAYQVDPAVVASQVEAIRAHDYELLRGGDDAPHLLLEGPDDADFDLMAALRAHRDLLRKKIDRLHALVETVDDLDLVPRVRKVELQQIGDVYIVLDEQNGLLDGRRHEYTRTLIQ